MKKNNLPTRANLINGNWVQSEERKETMNPATGEIIGYYYEPNEGHLKEAISAAKDTFDYSDWKDDRELRARALNELADQIENRKDELIELIAKENGKIAPEAAFEFSLTPSKLRYYAALALSDQGKSAEVKKGAYSRLVSEPIGVAGVIVPWNAPLVLSVRSFAPALAAGCTCVIKMPAQTALVNGLIAEIIANTESLPKGVIHMITESGDTVSKGLVQSPDVGVISYTGSTKVGGKIMEASGSQLKRMSLELGGKTPMIVFDDAELDEVIPTLVGGITTFGGQFCMTGSRILVQEGIADEVEKRLKEALENVKVGPGNHPDSQMGALIHEQEAIRVDQIVESSLKHGEAIVRGGRGQKEGEMNQTYDAYYRPSLIKVNDTNTELIQEETFGPVASFEVFKDDEEAIQKANATNYGLAASIWTTSRHRSLTLPEKIQAGTVWVNGWGLVFDQFEEGGFKQSGLGRLNGETALSEFQEFKHIVQVT